MATEIVDEDPFEGSHGRPFTVTEEDLAREQALFDAQVNLLGGLLKPLVADALRAEVAQVAADEWIEQASTALSVALSEDERPSDDERLRNAQRELKERLKKELSTDLVPDRSEIETHTCELAQCVLSNWFSLLQDALDSQVQTTDGARVRLDAKGLPDAASEQVLLEGTLAFALDPEVVLKTFLTYYRSLQTVQLSPYIYFNSQGERKFVSTAQCDEERVATDVPPEYSAIAAHHAEAVGYMQNVMDRLCDDSPFQELCNDTDARSDLPRSEQIEIAVSVADLVISADTPSLDPLEGSKSDGDLETDVRDDELARAAVDGLEAVISGSDVQGSRLSHWVRRFRHGAREHISKDARVQKFASLAGDAWLSYLLITVAAAAYVQHARSNAEGRLRARPGPAREIAQSTDHMVSVSARIAANLLTRATRSRKTQSFISDLVAD